MFDGAAVATASIVSAEQTAQNQAEDSISSGDAATTDAPTNEPSATADQALLDALEALDVSSTRQEMLFVSTNVLDYQQLLDGISLNVAAQILIQPAMGSSRWRILPPIMRVSILSI